MHRRTYLGLAGGALAGLAGCTASALPGPDGADDPTPAADCPDLLDADRSVCPGDTGGPLTVDRSSETVAGGAWTLRIAVTNASADPYGYNPHAWSVHRKNGNGWTHVAPDAHIEPWAELVPGDRYTWQLSAAQTSSDEADQRVFLDLDPGDYAFAVSFQGPDRVAAVAPFTVVS